MTLPRLEENILNHNLILETIRGHLNDISGLTNNKPVMIGILTSNMESADEAFFILVDDDKVTPVAAVGDEDALMESSKELLGDLKDVLNGCLENDFRTANYLFDKRPFLLKEEDHMDFGANKYDGLMVAAVGDTSEAQRRSISRTIRESIFKACKEKADAARKSAGLD